MYIYIYIYIYIDKYIHIYIYICILKKTYCHFFRRAAVHISVSNITEKWLKNIEDSAVSDHLLQCNCTIDFDYFDILLAGVSKFNLLLKANLLIKRDNPALNRTTKSFPSTSFSNGVS